MLEQIETYIDDRDMTGWYYGNKAQFEKRHIAIKSWLAEELYKARKKECRCNDRDALMCHECEESDGVCYCRCHDNQDEREQKVQGDYGTASGERYGSIR